MISARLNSDNYHSLIYMVLREMRISKDDLKKISYLEELLYKLEEHMCLAYYEEHKNEGDDDE